ncbi:FKBP-type peptidyl-prolyl cis-trans isomerase [Candidatus Sulfidibacterium hydrothermale]|uniref:FKBP-type peptidyl-prolyl cis-trans isomerase n=1 Tax=Candidatus Sulfidibacterium hydrothermale TaxID=2875962 RepID=UPI001F0B282D|nr:FKBP-type peptidyl-prolyl cis-trans isomerase [Candidatus Sulfidibacterium hydrothermale]UBM62891.1 FKBP-type peptidyl-prolyl cis-trans isomerase [Candidatus Sulfidibacterium hydrothermale]
MKAGNNKVVTMTYTLRLNDENGKIIQQVDESRPFVQLFGVGALLPAFEKNINGLEAGDTFGFQLSAEEGYGNPSDEAILKLDKKIFEIDGKFDPEMVAVGKTITMQDNQGNPLDGKVLAVEDDSVIMDFNHPLAGENLYFSGTVLDVRDATEEELAHGHAHAGGHHHE